MEGRSVCEPYSEAMRAAERARYSARRTAGACVRCTGPAMGGPSRCAWHAAQAGPPFYTVIELDSGADHGTYETEAETAAYLAFLGLRIDKVEIISNVPLMASSLTGMP